MKNLKRNTLLLLLITLTVLFFVLKDDFSNIVNTLLSVNIWWIILAIVFMFLNWFTKTNCIYLLSREYKKDISWLTLFKQTLIFHFFCGITPFSTGGEPMQIYMLKKNGLKIAHATSVVLQNFVIYQIVLVLFGSMAVWLNYQFNLFESIPVLKEIVILGFLINCLVALALFVIIFSKKLSKVLLKLGVFLGVKFKIFKDKEKTTIKYQKKLNEFHECSTLFKKEKLLFVRLFFNNFIGMALYYSIPLLIIYSMGNYESIDIMTSIVATAYVMIVSNFVPIPGASGGIEYGFMQFYGVFITGPILSSVLLIWRFITYYLGMILGAILVNFNKGDETK